MVPAVLALVAAGFAISLPMSFLLVRAGHRLGTLDSPGARGHVKRELRPVPNIGGIAIAAGVLVPLALALLALAFTPAEALASWIARVDEARAADLAARAKANVPTLAALLLATLALHATGLIDDRRGLSAGPKVLVQILAAAAMVLFVDVRVLELLGPIPSAVLTVLWIVAVTNAINFLDNMDGLAGGVAAIAASLFLTVNLLHAQWFVGAAFALLLGAILGFLVLNFPPAKIFMGDGGSLLIGFLLAVLSIRTTYFGATADLGDGAAAPWAVFTPLVVLAIPLYDFLSVTVLRLAQGRSPFTGDQQHFSHRLVQRGLTTRGAVVVIWSLTAVTGIGGVALGSLAAWQAALVGLQTALVLVTLLILEHASRHAARRMAS